MTIIATHPGVENATQDHLTKMWELIDSGEPKDKVVAWLRKYGHKSISDWMATEVASLIENGKRSASVV